MLHYHAIKKHKKLANLINVLYYQLSQQLLHLLKCVSANILLENIAKMQACLLNMWSMPGFISLHDIAILIADLLTLRYCGAQKSDDIVHECTSARR